MNHTFRLWEYTGVDSIYDPGKLISDFTDYIKKQKYDNNEIIIDMYPEGYNLYHNGVWAIIESVCRACDIHPATITLVIGDLCADYPCNTIIHQPRWLMESATEFANLEVPFYKVIEKTFLHFIGRATWDRVGVQMFLRGRYLSECYTTMAPTTDRHRVLHDTVTKILQMRQPEGVKKDMIEYTLRPPKNHLTECTRNDLITFPNNVIKLKDYYVNAFVEVVHETDINAFFITEKTIRPILFKRPFITMGCKNFMSNLQKLGFKTFDEWFDERYDQADGFKRYDLILRRLKAIGDKSHEELSRINVQMQETCEHNFQHLINKGWVKYLDEFDVQFWHDGKGQLL